jgi:hypothetical protein
MCVLCRVVNLTLTFAPLSLFKWQLYASQGMRNKWYSFMGEGFGEESDDDQDSMKVRVVCALARIYC